MTPAESPNSRRVHRKPAPRRARKMEGLRTAPATGLQIVSIVVEDAVSYVDVVANAWVARRPMGKPPSRQVERDTDRDAAQRRMDWVESIRALVQVLDGSRDMAVRRILAR
jgi:hypothetical protein